MPSPQPLPELLDIASAPALQRDLLGRRGESLEIDASAVQFVGGLGLQVLLSAVDTWAKDGHALTVINRSPAFADALRVTGVSLPDAA